MNLAWALFSFKALANQDLNKIYWAMASELIDDNDYMRKAYEQIFVINVTRLFCFLVQYGWKS